MNLTAAVSPAVLCNAIRALAMDAVQKANSGHPGMPMGMAEIAYALWQRHLNHDPANPKWADRDRFVLSNGHGSMLLYSLLHLTGYDLPMEELRNFRQLHSKTPGHPEYGMTPGVETTTGPLGQGLANAVGMALAEKLLADAFNQPGHTIVDHRTYVFAGDGCLMEGISHEACSLAGTLGLSKLIVFYDDNGISIDGEVKGWFTDDTPKRFEAYGWQVIANVNGHDIDAVDAAIIKAKADAQRPTLICCKTIIGKGAPNKQGSAKTHGEALGVDEVAATRKALGWDQPPFEIPDEIYAGWDARQAGRARSAEWNKRFAAFAKAFPAEAKEFERRMAGELPSTFTQLVEQTLATQAAKSDAIATRKASQIALEALKPAMPELVGGSADLTGSNLTLVKASKSIARDQPNGNYVYFGVREFGMCAIMNGLALHGGLIPYGGTFLVFSDYARNAVRMSALMKQRVVFVFTHDSIGLGEDGPTHQAVEHVSSLRLIPNLDVWRPCDAAETLAAWANALERRDGPSALALSRQGVPPAVRDAQALAAIRRGGYVLRDAPNPAAVILATGTEISLALQAADALAKEHVAVRVVSMPCTNVFDRQEASYRASVLPHGVPRVAVEAGVSDLWRKYVGLEGAVIGVDRFGESAPAGDVYKYLGVTLEKLVAAVKLVRIR